MKVVTPAKFRDFLFYYLTTTGSSRPIAARDEPPTVDCVVRHRCLVEGNVVAMKRLIIFAAMVCAVAASTAQAQPVLVYDAISDQTAGTTTGTNPHMYMGQGFSMSNAAGNTPMITGF